MKRTPTKLLNAGTALVVAVALLMSTSTMSSARPEPKSTGLQVLRTSWLAGESHWTKTLDPAIVTDVTSITLIGLINANLVRLDTDGKVASDLATWTESKNHKVYTFTIRKNARFSNGDVVTAQDARFTLLRALAKDTASPVAYYDTLIKGFDAYNTGKTNDLSGVKVLNKRTLQVTISAAAPYFLKAFTYVVNDVLDSRVVKDKAVDTYLTNTCAADVGAGPFKPVCQNRSSDVTSFYPSGRTPALTLAPNPHYYGPKPHIKIIIPTIADAATAFNAYQAGQLDTAPLTSEKIAKYHNSKEFHHWPIGFIDYLAPNLQEKPFSNVHCRLAVAYALDRDTLIKSVLHGTRYPLYGLLPKGVLGYYAGKDNPHFNLNRAKAELAQCPGGINVDVPYPSYSVDYDNEFAAIQNMMAAAGITMNPKKLSESDWLGLISQPLSKTHNAIIFDDWVMDYPDPQDFLYYLLHSGQGYNCEGFNDKTYDRLVDQADASFNTSTRIKLTRQAQHVALSKGAWIAIDGREGFALVKPYVHGFIYNFYASEGPSHNNWSTVSVSSH